MRRILLTCVLLAGLVACGDGGLDPLPLQVTIAPSRTTAGPGEVVEFVVTARGGSIVGIEIDYGDASVVEQRGASGARTARITFEHAYAATGTYEVRTTVFDAAAGSKDASVEVRVQ